LNTCSALIFRVEHLEHDNVAQRLEIVKLKARVKKLEQTDQVKSSKLRRLRKKDNSEVQDVVEVVTTVKLITEVVTAVVSQGSAASATIPAASATIPAVSATIPAVVPTVVVAYTRRRKGVTIRDPEEELPLKTPAETPKDAAMDHVNQKSSSNPQYIKRYQGMKKRPQTESEARKNMMIYLKNTAGYKMDFFKGMTYAQICPIFQARFNENIRFFFKLKEEMEAEDQEIIKSINETPAQMAAKRRKLTTPLASKVPVVDYQIVLIDNKPRLLFAKSLNDAEGVVRLPNEEIFAGLAQIGYEKPSTKLTFYKAFFSSQWKFLIHTILQSLSAKRTSWNEFSTSMASAVICLSKEPSWRLSTHTTRFISLALTQKVFANMRRVGKGFSGVETPLFEGMLAVRQPAEEGVAVAQVQVDDAVAAAIEENIKENVAEYVSHDAIPSPPHHDIPSPSQALSLPPQQPQSSHQDPPQVESSADIEDVFNQRRMIDDMDKNEGIELEDDSEVYEVVEIVTTANHITEVVTAAASQVSAASTTIPAASATIPAAKPSILAAAPTVVSAYTRRRKGVIIKDPEEELPLKTLDETPKVTDKGKEILVETPKPMKKKDQIELDAEYEKKLHEEINKDYEEFSKDIDWDAAMDHVNQKSTRFDENIRFLFKSREEMEAEDQEIIKSINETPVQKAAKRRKLSEEAQEAEDLRKRLEVVEDEDDDVFFEATPLASKVSVVDYQIVLIDNKPRFKIIRADETHQFYISFTTLLKNFDREDLESLWRIVKDKFSTLKPTNFLDEYLLLTLKTMFEEPNGQDAIWRNQKSVHGLALVKRWKLLTSCGVYVITLSTVQLFLLVER
nr:hypothetical protein [Tanacetum cinerariifolium]